MNTGQAKAALEIAMGSSFVTESQKYYNMVYRWCESVDAGDKWPNWYWAGLLEMKKETHPELFN